MEDADTICAISTPGGEGGIGIVRISGPRAHAILRQIFEPKEAREDFEPRRLYFGYITDPHSGISLDEVFAVFMRSPRTYTREDMGEIHSHGGPAVLRAILSLVVAAGARPAEAGEFTRRAFLNGRIDLLQAEAVLDVIRSETEEELKHAVSCLKGSISRQVSRFREAITEALVEIEALIDFPEEEIELTGQGYVEGLRKASRDLTRLIDSYYEGRGIRHGYEVLIVGRTNVGKSSLLNMLMAEEKAIVTPLPGTTRDMVEGTLHVKGIKMILVDSAGIRDPKDVAEEEGIGRVKKKIPEADLILWVLDGSEPLTEEDRAIGDLLSGADVLGVINKVDLPLRLDRSGLPASLKRVVAVSCRDETGHEELKAEMYGSFLGRRGRTGGLIITNLRHKNALTRARDGVDRALEGATGGLPLEVVAFELREALFHLGEITGETCAEEVLNTIFDRFCIGK